MNERDAYGYYTDKGFYGRLPCGDWVLFATQEEYLEYLDALKEAVPL